MGHTYVELTVFTSKGEYKERGVMVDTGATYTILPQDILEKIGAFKLPTKVPLELGDGRTIEAETFAASAKIADREGPIIIASFENAKPLIGVQTLESLGLKVNPVTGELEETRPKGIAYL